MHVISALQLGGAERVAINLALQHAVEGVCTAVVTVRAAKAADDPVGLQMRQVLRERRIPLFEIGGQNLRLNLLKLPLRLASLVRRTSPDLVHSHTDVPDFVVSSARRLTRFRVARTIHNTSLWATHRAAGFVAEHGLKDDLVVGVSRGALAAYRSLRNEYGLPSSNHQNVIINGVQIHPPDIVGARLADGHRGKPLHVAFFGRSAPSKGLDVLVDALLSRREHQRLPLKLSIFSDAVHDDDFRRRVQLFPCDVHLSEPVPDAADRMSQFDLVVVPSRAEGLCLVALEALAAGTPVLATRIPGLEEVFPPDWPLFVPPEDPEGLMNMLTAVATGRFDLNSLGNQGYEHIREHSVEQCSRAYLDCYREYVGHAS
jgi:glycosyltransferase involved in cell wall biosynthesis